MIIDIHGHFTTAPATLERWRRDQLDAHASGLALPRTGPRISDDEIREAIEGAQLTLMDERGIDLTVFSPRASHMAHHLGDSAVSQQWAGVCNDLVARVAGLYPQRFAAAAMLPQSPDAPIAWCLPELDRCVRDHNIVGVNLNPDPSGGRWTAPPLTDSYWFALYERLVDYDLPAMIHVSTSCVPAVHTTGAYYLAADTTAFMQLLAGDLFARFPTLRFVIPHGGGAAPYHWGRFRGLAQALGRPDDLSHVLGNVYFDTCVYHQAGIDLLTQVVPHDNILFASEMIGAVRGVDPLTGFSFDDTLRYLDASEHLSASARAGIVAGNAARVYPRLDVEI